MAAELQLRRVRYDQRTASEKGTVLFYCHLRRFWVPPRGMHGCSEDLPFLGPPAPSPAVVAGGDVVDVQAGRLRRRQRQRPKACHSSHRGGGGPGIRQQRHGPRSVQQSRALPRRFGIGLCPRVSRPAPFQSSVGRVSRPDSVMSLSSPGAAARDERLPRRSVAERVPHAAAEGGGVVAGLSPFSAVVQAEKGTVPPWRWPYAAAPWPATVRRHLHRFRVPQRGINDCLTRQRNATLRTRHLPRRGSRARGPPAGSACLTEPVPG